MKNRTQSTCWYRRPGDLIAFLLLLAGLGSAVLGIVLKSGAETELLQAQRTLEIRQSEKDDYFEETRAKALSYERLKRYEAERESALASVMAQLEEYRSHLRRLSENPNVKRYLAERDNMEKSRQEIKQKQETLNKESEVYRRMLETAYE